MLRIANLRKYYGDRLLFENVSFEISAGEKVSVVGANGSGKSTLLKIVAGLLDTDDGYVRTCGEPTIAYLPQHMEEDGAISVGKYLVAEFYEARRLLHQLERSFEDQAENWCSSKYAKAFERFERSGGYSLDEQLENILDGLQMQHVDLHRSIDTLSGGERTRASLARILLLRADILLLDEPTNNLDLAGVEWLENTLANSNSASLIVSHDRTFLDRVTNRTIEIDPVSSRITNYSGNYSWYKMRKRQDEERQLRQFKEQQVRIKRLTEDIRAVKNQAMVTEKSTQDDYLRGRAKKVAAKAKAREARLTRMIELEKIEKPRVADQPKFSLRGHLQYSSNLIQVQDLSYEIEGNQILTELNLNVVGSSRIAVTGNNGSGKSTLLKLLAGEFEPTSGFINRKPNLRVGYLPQHQESLPNDQTVLECFKSLVRINSMSRAEQWRTASNMVPANKLTDGDIRTLLHRFQFSRNDVFKKVDVLSRGERTKLILATFMACELDLLVMDEPTNHLDTETIECFEQALYSFKGALIVVSHDRYFLENLSPEYDWHLDQQTVKQK